ncbi:SLC13 family permease [Saccharopolyspora sp. NPDC049357]|uniref:SLC13 family permease n=1 Tax=Saccharopolyspora sp. NPDC049357 TaxID=3154507 RepID=UPI0034346609
MEPQVLSIIVLVLMFAVGTALPINMGVLAFVAAFILGTLSLGMTTDQIIAGFPSDLFLTLVGITYLFGIAQINGTIDLLVQWAVRLVGGRVRLIPWVFFVVSALLTSIGALFAVAIVAPLAMRCAARHSVNRLLMGMFVVHGALGGAFAPTSVYGGFVNGVMADRGLPSSPMTVFLVPLVFNLAIGLIWFVLFGKRAAPDQPTAADEAWQNDPGTGVGPTSPFGPTTADQPGSDSEVEPRSSGNVQTLAPAAETAPTPRITTGQSLTIVGILVLAAGTVIFQLDVGFLSMAIAAVLAIASPKAQRGAVDKISWSTVLLIGGVLTYVSVMQEAGAIDYASSAVTGLGMPLLAGLLLCYVGGISSAFASSVGILGALIPLSVPFLQQGMISPTGMVAALAVAATVVDVSPFSTNGALVLANAEVENRERFYRQMLAYSGIVVALGPLLAWLVVVLPGWL